MLHALWAWRPAKGENRIFYIPREWLHEAWRELHGAPITKVKKFRKDAREGRRMARYLMTQYVAGQDALQHSGGSYRRTFGFSLPKVWTAWKAWAWMMQMTYKEMLEGWQALLRREMVWYGAKKVWLGPKGLWDGEEPHAGAGTERKISNV